MINQIKKTTIVSEHPLQSPQPVPTHHTDDMLTKTQVSTKERPGLLFFTQRVQGAKKQCNSSF